MSHVVIKVYNQSGSFHISCHYLFPSLTYFWLYTKVLTLNISSNLSGHECIDDKQEVKVMVRLILHMFSGSFLLKLPFVSFLFFDRMEFFFP